MAISFSRYINIVSGVGGNAAIKTRDLITRVMTTNSLVPPQSFFEFESAAEVEAIFGSQSEEYSRAADYFAFVSKQNTSPDKISFGRWVNAAAVPEAFGDPNSTETLAQLVTITAGKMTVTIGAVTATLTGLNFTGAASFADIATIIQTALVAVAGLSGSTVTYLSIAGGPSFFVIYGPTAGTAAGTISFNTDPSNTVSSAIGMLSPATIIGQGSDVETITQTLTNTVNASTNLATFVFMNFAALTLSQVEEAAIWLQTQNVNFAFEVETTVANAAAWSAALFNYEGVWLTLAPLAAEYPEMIPGKIAAATDYTKRNTSQNYMYQQDNTVTPSVTTDAGTNVYDPLRVNYYGQTQENGQDISFYQRGISMGGASAPTDMSVYINEIWLRGAVGNNIMGLLLAVSQVPATNRGRAMLLGVIQPAIDQGLFNGVISSGELLTPVQQQYIQNVVGDTGQAAAQVATIGYFVDVTFSSIVADSGAVEYQANYQIIYAKDNAIRKVNGTHTLI